MELQYTGVEEVGMDVRLIKPNNDHVCHKDRHNLYATYVTSYENGLILF